MILLDGMMQLYRCNYKLSDLVTRDGRLTGMEYGFLKGLEAFRRFWDDEIIVCWEGAKNFRYSIDPNYKANRRAKRTKDSHQWLTSERMTEFKRIVSMVAETAFDDELEADDVMGSLAKKYAQTEDVIIYSGDKDMHQMLQDKPYKIHQCKEYQYRKNLWTPKRLALELHGITPELYPIFLALVGDKVDNITGCGAKHSFIAQALLDGHTIDNITDFIRFTSKDVFKLEHHIDSGNYAKNLKLIKLRIKEVPIIKRDWKPAEIGAWLQKMEFRTLKLCQQVGIEATVEEDEEF